MRVTILASGSSGNATLIEAGETRLLVDAGVAPQTLEQELATLGVPGIDAVLVTHGHDDHVGFAHKLGVPIWSTESTQRFANFPRESLRLFAPRAAFGVGALTITPVPVPHDAAQVALLFEHQGARAAIVTDLGEVTGALFDLVRSVPLLLLEANHDADMLAWGPYPAFLKRRVASARGHLSNAQTAELVRRLDAVPRELVLMHLSEKNNAEELALQTVRASAPAGTTLRCAPRRRAISFTVDEPKVARKPVQLSLF